jgi:hypothetical protein
MLHDGVVPGHPASHGCIRLKNDFAIRLWHLPKAGTRVIIAHDDVQPVELANPHLFKPKAVAGSQEFQAAAVAGKSISTAAATLGSLAPNAEASEATGLQAPGSVLAAGAPRKIVPISVPVIRKLSKLFARQGFSPLFDVPVEIENPQDRPERMCSPQWNSRTRERLFAGPLCRFRMNFLACPMGPRKSAKRPRAQLTSTGNIDQGHIVYYRASKGDCSRCSLKPKCTTAVVCKITRDINEDVRDSVRALANTEAFQQSRRERKKVEMRFTHMKRILQLDRLRLRGLNGVRTKCC